MTTSVAPAAPSPATQLTTQASQANSTSDTGSASRAGRRDDFSRPLAQARQQHMATHAAMAAAVAPKAAPVQVASSSAGVAPSPPNADAADQDKSDTKATSSKATDAAAAMLALLGQSVPANAAPAPAAAPATAGNVAIGDASVAVAPSAIQAGVQVVAPQPAMQIAGQADADDMRDGAKSLDALADKMLTAVADDAGDSADAATATGSTGFADMTKALAGMTAVTTSNNPPGNHTDPLDALRALTAAPLQQAPIDSPAVAAPHALTMQSTAGTPAFAQELGQQVAWLGGQDVKQARIRLHPEDLGELDVKVSVQHGSVDVSFVAQHPQAVHAVQQTLSQLDSMLANHGLSLGQAQVGQGGKGGEQGQGANASGPAGNDIGNAEGGELAAVAAPIVKAVGLLDMFA